MSIRGKDVVELAVDAAVGTTVAGVIEESLGEGILSDVLSVSAGMVAGGVTHKALKIIDDETDIVSDVGGLMDDVLSIFD